MSPSLFLQQKDSKTRLELDDATYEYLFEEGHLIRYGGDGPPIITLPHMPDTPDNFDSLDAPDRAAFATDTPPECSQCGATDAWDLCFQYAGRRGTVTVAKCTAERTAYGGQTKTCAHLAMAYDIDEGPVEYFGNVDV